MPPRVTVPNLAGSRWILAAAVLAVVAIMNVTSGMEVTMLLGITLGGLSLVAILVRPQAATLLVVFLLYTNIPVVASQLHGVPRTVAGAFMVLLALPLARHVLLRREGFRVDGPLLLLLCYLAVMCASAIGAQDLGIAMVRIQTFVLEGLVLYWLFLNVVRGVPALRVVIGTALVAGAFLGALSVYQAATGQYDRQFMGLAQRQLAFRADENRDVPTGEGPRMYRSDRAEGPIGDPNRYAQIMIVLLPLAVASMRRPQSRRNRLLFMAGTAAVLAGTLLSYSRGGYLALAVMAVAAAGFGWIRPRLLAIAGLVLAVTAPIVAPTQVKRLLTVGQVTQILVEGRAARQVDASIRGRLTEMLAAANVFLDHPVAGVGPGQYSPFYSEEYQQNPSTKFRDIRGTRRAHNLYFELAAEVGLLGLVAFFSIAFLIVHQLWAWRRRWLEVRPEFADLATAFILAIVGYFATAVFLHLSFERYYWFLLALAGITVLELRLEWQRYQASWPDPHRQTAAWRPPATWAQPGVGA